MYVACVIEAIILQLFGLALETVSVCLM